MTGLELPSTGAEPKAAFLDAKGAEQWLAQQPRANASLMLAGLVNQLRLVAPLDLSARERFKILEILRKQIFAVHQECRRRFEYKPLPLMDAERDVAMQLQHLWQLCREGYVSCVQACLNLDTGISKYSARVIHRTLVCLLQEMNVVSASGRMLDAGFWRCCHSLHVAAAQLLVQSEEVDDSALPDLKLSSPEALYVLIVLLYLIDASQLTRAQWQAVTRWLARWREGAELSVADPNEVGEASSGHCFIDQDSDWPVWMPEAASSLSQAGHKHWCHLKLNTLLRKVRKRLDDLMQGADPESLHLGNSLDRSSCEYVLFVLLEGLRNPVQSAERLLGKVSVEHAPSTMAVVGLEKIYRLIGGKPLDTGRIENHLFGSYLQREQLAVFDHVASVHDVGLEKGDIENWLVIRREQGLIELARDAGTGESRLQLGSLMALRLAKPVQKADAGEDSLPYALVEVKRLRCQPNGMLMVGAKILAKGPKPLMLEMRERPSGQVSRHPALSIQHAETNQSQVLFSPGLTVRALSMRFLDAVSETPIPFQQGEVMARSADAEQWSFVPQNK